MSFQLGGAYVWSDVHAALGAAFVGFGDTLSSAYSARTFQMFGEVALKRQVGEVMLQPFAGVAHVALFDAQMSETGGAAALHGGDSDEHVTHGSLGLRTQAAFEAGDLGLRLKGAASWRHAFGDRAPTIDLTLSTGLSFRTAGVPIDKDALALDVGLDADLNKAVSLGISYSGSYGDRATDHGARAVLNWRL
ncbi:hypothetical protein BH10PSE3_BH10PSE3_19740 [soil metagenome]